MSFPDGLTASVKDAWFLTGAAPSTWSNVFGASGLYQKIYRLSIARRYAGMTNFATQNGTMISVADVAGLNSGTGIWTSKDGATAISPDWTAITGAGSTTYIDRHGTTPDSPMATKGEETLDLVWSGTFETFDPLEMTNPVDTLPAWNTSGQSAANILEMGDSYLLQSQIPENTRYFTPYMGTAGKWVSNNVFTMVLTRKFVGLTAFVSLIDMSVKTTGMPTILSGVGITTAFDYADVTAQTDGSKRLYTADEKVNITNTITGEGDHVLTMRFQGPLEFTDP